MIYVWIITLFVICFGLLVSTNYGEFILLRQWSWFIVQE